jgi:transposase-like protein
MSGQSRYSDEDKAAVLAALAANGGNLLRTAKETGVSRNTIRHWVQEAPPPDETLQAAIDTFVSEATTVRNRALEKLKEAIESPDTKPRDLITIIGVLDDKVTRASGLPTSRTEHQNALPPREELKELLGTFVQVAVEAAEQRDSDIEDAAYVVVPQPRALPQPREQA